MADFISDLRGVYRDFFGSEGEMPNDEQLVKLMMEDRSLELMKHLDDQLQQAGSHALTDATTLVGKIDASVGADRTAGLVSEKDQEPAAADAVPAEEAVEEEPQRPAMDELNELIGLENIKHDVKELTALAKIKKVREDRGMKTVPVSLHLVFSGNPGTGKTTVARLLARLYREAGILSKGQLVEVDRSGLVAGYVGQTAIKTQEVIQQSLGGILFVDEAYALSQKDDAFGQECIDTILKAMEDNRNDFVVIVAGYTEPMKKFINSNPGLKSRFNKYFQFPDYSADELQAIFHQQCGRYQYTLTPESEEKMRGMIEQMEANKGRNFANARSVRNLFESVITNQATRISALEDPSEEQLTTILPEDLEGIDLPSDDSEKQDQATTLEDVQQARESLIDSLQQLLNCVDEQE